ncbi:MAG: peptidase [Acidimicrobiales bacterium]|nr:peptidase [Acidimicrobiales bacterium]
MRTLVAGIGNIFNRDDGFGVEVAQRLVTRPQPDDVRVEDYGIRGVHLALELLEGYDLLVLVDAMACGEPPGTVVVVEPRVDGEAAPPLDAHRMDPRSVLAMVTEMGGEVGRVLVVGCEPADLDDGLGLSPTVAAAVDAAVGVVEDLIAERNSSCSVA